MFPDILKNLYLNDTLKSTLVKISKSEATVLVTGETGVGKEVVATAIHGLSNRSSLPPVFINVAAIPQDLLEKELFGALSGAFTDSKENYIGKFQQANGSTIVLDEIGELPLITQGKLLGAIENGIIQQLGSNETIVTDCRVIAITNRDLPKLVKEGKFRKDLYYRLNVLSLEIPPLRERTSLLRSIINSFLVELSLDDDPYTLSKEALTSLVTQNWPGNLRELKNCLERAVAMTNTREISSDYLLLSSKHMYFLTT